MSYSGTYLDPTVAPTDSPLINEMEMETRTLHETIDQEIRRSGHPSLHPAGTTVQTDLFGSPQIIAWQEAKGASTMLGEECWSNLPQIYARYGTEPGRKLMEVIQSLERARGVLLTDCGMQATSIVQDVILRPDGHAIISRQVYNKSKAYLTWTSQRLDIQVTIVEHLTPEVLATEARPNTTLVFAETYTNPLMRALDVVGLAAGAERLRANGSPNLRLVIDNTIATPWAVATPLLAHKGVDAVVAAGTKALGGEDRDMWGYIASNRIPLLNQAMDIQAMRGGALSWRSSAALLDSIASAEDRFRKRCSNADTIVQFLEAHPQVSEVFHPTATNYIDAEIYQTQYKLGGSIISFRLDGQSEEETRHFCDVLATTIVFRYSLSFDGLVSKVNHHKSVSEYYAPPPLLKKQGIDRIIRLGIGVEAPTDLLACLNWALWNFKTLSEEEVLKIQGLRIKSLNLPTPD